MTIQLFQPGAVYLTEGIQALIEDKGLDIMPVVWRHLTGDWGDLDADDAAINWEALRRGGRLFSCYKSSDAKTVYVITESDRQSTTVCTADEY